MKATAIMKSGLASSPAYSDAVFVTGTTKGNKWILLGKRSTGTIYDIPDWMALMWNAINSLMMEGAEFHANNPTGYDINDKTLANEKKKMEREARKNKL